MPETNLNTRSRKRKVHPYSLPEYNGPQLFNDLRMMTPEQFRAVMDGYLKLPPDELTHRMEVVHAMWKRLSSKPDKTVALMNLNVQQGLMHCAVDRLMYPKDVPVDILTHARSLVGFYTRGSAGVGWLIQDEA